MGRTTGRLPRFRRASENLRTIRVTPRDERIIRLVGNFRFLRSTQIVRMVDGAPTEIIRRLQKLFHHGYLTRPRCQIDFYHRGGTRPIVYGLDRKGAELLRNRTAPVGGGPSVSPRSETDQVSRLFLDHTLLVSEVLIGLEEACRRSSLRIRYTTPGEVRASDGEGKQFFWKVTVRRRRVGLIPDSVFGVEVTEPHGKAERIVLFLEADRGTMPVTRRAPHQSSIARKLAAYSALWKEGSFEERFKTNRFAVLIVTTSATRSKNIAAAVRNLEAGAGLFMCLPLKELTADGEAVLLKVTSKDRPLEF